MSHFFYTTAEVILYATFCLYNISILTCQFVKIRNLVHTYVLFIQWNCTCAKLCKTLKWISFNACIKMQLRSDTNSLEYLDFVVSQAQLHFDSAVWQAPWSFDSTVSQAPGSFPTLEQMQLHYACDTVESQLPEALFWTYTWYPMTPKPESKRQCLMSFSI